MTPEAKYVFSQLKSSVTKVFLENNAAPNSMNEWKGDTIIDFQEDLFKKVKAKVSEKWFYTYFKNEPEKLPRIDMLNLLSEYVGYKNWNDFKNSRTYTQSLWSRKKIKTNVYVLVIAILLIAMIIYGMSYKNEFHFCFVDELKNERITQTSINIKILHDDESPSYLKSDSLGCFRYKTNKEPLKIVVSSPFYKTDTIIKKTSSVEANIIKLVPDDYSMMLYYYSNEHVENWKSHKIDLENLISDKALIYQLYENSVNVEIHSKDEFINLMTIPTKRLKGFKILDKKMSDGKITKLKFMVK